MTRALEALGIDVSAELLAQWATWFAPEHQPFLLSADSPLARAGHALDSSMTMETRDTFEIYSLPDGIFCRGITYEEFMALPREDRAELVRAQRALGRSQVPSVRAWPFIRPLGTAKQADGHRFVWWPTLLKGLEHEVLIPYIEEGRRASRHHEVDEQVWAEATVLLPDARALAAKSPPGSGPNGFGTVMGAAGVSGAASVWMQREPFEEWLSDVTRLGGSDDAPGTVLVWRSSTGLVQHAAVTLGGGWALHKPSQGWMSPVKVLTVADVIGSARGADRRLSRRLMR